MKITRFKDIPKMSSIGSYQVDVSLTYLKETIDRYCSDGYNLDMNPDFQRNHVWTPEQQIAYLIFFLRGGKTGNVIYLNDPTGIRTGNYTDFVLVDGKQRLNALLKFVNNEIPVFGSYYNEFTDNPPLDCAVKININNLKTRKEVIQWYVDFNTGGTIHTADEIQKAKDLLLEC